MGTSSSKNKVVITAHDRAILDLKIQRDKLKQYQKKLEVIITKEVDVAKHHLKNNDKKRALLALRKKKYQEQLLDQTDKQLFTLEQMTQTIEYSLIEKDIVAGLKKGNEVLTQIHKEMSVEAVAKLMDDTADAIAYQNEIDELLSGKITEDDEEDIVAELDAILEAELANAPKVPTNNIPIEEPEEVVLPEVPSTSLRTKTKDTTKKVAVEAT